MRAHYVFFAPGLRALIYTLLVPIRVLSQESKDEPVKADLIIATVEKNRDRIRTTSGMVITASGLLISACIGTVLFATDRRLMSKPIAWCFGAGLLCFLCSATVAVLSSVLKTDYRLSSEGQFTSDLLKVFYAELQLSRLAFAVFLLGLLLAVCGALFVVIR